MQVVWIWLGNLLRQEGVENQVSDLFYRELIQAVLLFGVYLWALSDVIMRIVESNHVGFLLQIMGNRERRKSDGSRETPADEEVLRAVGMHSGAT